MGDIKIPDKDYRIIKNIFIERIGSRAEDCNLKSALEFALNRYSYIKRAKRQEIEVLEFMPPKKRNKRLTDIINKHQKLKNLYNDIIREDHHIMRHVIKDQKDWLKYSTFPSFINAVIKMVESEMVPITKKRQGRPNTTAEDFLIADCLIIYEEITGEKAMSESNPYNNNEPCGHYFEFAKNIFRLAGNRSAHHTINNYVKKSIRYRDGLMSNKLYVFAITSILNS